MRTAPGRYSKWGLAADVAGPQARVGALREAVVEWQHVVLGGLGHEAILQIAQLLWLHVGEVVGLGEVLLDVVQLPGVIVETRAARGQPRQPAVQTPGDPWREPCAGAVSLAAFAVQSSSSRFPD